MFVTDVFRASCALLLVGVVGQLSAQNGDFRRSLPSGDHPDVYVATGSGNVRVTASDGDTVVIVGHVHAGWHKGEDASDRIRRILADPPIQQRGNEVRVGETEDPSIFKNISIDYEIRAPRDAALNVRTGSGDTEVEGVGRFLAADSGSGTLRVHRLHGPAELHTGSGDIELEQTGEGGVRARTGSGSLRLTGLRGSLEAHTGSGDIEAAGAFEGPGEISSGSGNLRLRFAAGDRVTLRASTGSGTIHADLPGFNFSSDDRHSVQGQINGGGPALNLRTSSGDIDLKQQ